MDLQPAPAPQLPLGPPASGFPAAAAGPAVVSVPGAAPKTLQKRRVSSARRGHHCSVGRLHTGYT